MSKSAALVFSYGLVGLFALSGCIIENGAAGQNPPSGTTGATLGSSTTVGSGTQLTSDATESSPSLTSGSMVPTGSGGAGADCVGVHPEGTPRRLVQARNNEMARLDVATGTSTQVPGTGSSAPGTTTSAVGTTSMGGTSTAPTSSAPAGTTTGMGTGTSSTGADGCVHPACVGDLSIPWELHDHQPRSCGYGHDYGQDAFFGKPTLVVLLAGWCGYCRAQAVGLEKLRIQWEREGKDINIVIINASSANTREYRDELVNSGSNPVFQDTAFTNTWGKLQGRKDDMYIYDAEGVLRHFLPHTGDVNTNLSEDEGFMNLKIRTESVLMAK